MIRVGITASLLAVAVAPAYAVGLDQSQQPIGALFAKGNYAELSFGYAMPNVSGIAVAGGASSGNMANNKTPYGFSVKKSFNDKLDGAVIYEQPFGADISYPTGTGYYAAGVKAQLNTASLTGLLKYKVTPHFSIYGGVRYETLDASATILTKGGPYTLAVPTSSAFGYVAGVAYEAPALGRRVSLTYNSPLNHNTTSVEAFRGTTTSSSTPANFPQSVRAC
jgi:long-chain fatty acid transport protein